MTSPTAPTLPRSRDRVETFLDWFRVNTTMIAGAAIIVLLALAGFWILSRTRANQAQRAEIDLRRAQQAYESRNYPLAETDLRRLVNERGSTPAGIQGALLLAELHYTKGEYQKGIEVLRALADRGAADGIQPAVLSMIGDGESLLNKPAEAAESYRRAAEAAAQDGERAFQLAKRARALAAANKPQEARQLWTELATNPAYQSVAAEARVRLGELSAQPATRS